MAGNDRSRQRIEPSFEADRPRGGGEMRMEAEDRIGGSGRGARPAKAAKPAKAGKTRRARGGGISGFLRFVTYWCLVLGIWGGIGIAGLVIYYGARMPSASTWSIPDRPPNIKITAVDGTTIANRGSTGGEALSLENMSPYIPMAVIAIEDRRFYSHFGVDPLGLARAMLTNVTTGRMVQGGSTLTQQLAKNMFLSQERTLERKVQEVLLAFWLEQSYSKDQILAMYLNRVFFGSNAYGVEAASRRYFNKSARDVNLGEAALLAGLLKAPSRLSPARDPAAAEARAQLVLGAMREEGFITETEIKTAMSQTPTQAKSYWSGAEHYVADMVMDQLPALVGDIKEDLVVDTTIDIGLEKKAEEALTKALDADGKKLNASQAALVSIDGTGAVRALVGGRDYAESQFNRAVTAKRQPGSAFKPFVYAAALEMGISPGSIRNDAPVKIGKWTPENYDLKYRGQVTLASALANSLNTIAAQLVMEVGPAQVAKVAHRLGIESSLQANASIALGTSEVSLLELTSAYAPFMNGGYKATAHVIRRISTASGTVLYENTYDNPPRVLSEAVVINMNAMLMRVITEGTGKKARLDGWQVAGKSGTTQSFRDALFVGYTSNLTTGVWFGNDDGKSMKKVTGGGLPAIAWHDFMTAAHEGLSPAPLFGSGQPAEEIPPSTIEPAEELPSTIGDIISNADPETNGNFPDLPAEGVGGEATASTPRRLPGDLEEGVPMEFPEDSTDAALNQDLVPPAEVGGNAVVSTQNQRRTLLDVLMGQ
ncbi:transglycosylase domain-containing protein [Rhizobium sp. LjRoot30]|uniref:transglycosylase domain-containing protein n=1 Tax=Rhizobium sp. LjRoot30 TaxID=3342320 RepID=UPI003ECDE473